MNERFPRLIQELYRVVSELEAMFPGHPFTPDGHMVGSLAECFAEYYYDLKLFTEHLHPDAGLPCAGQSGNARKR